MSNILLFVSNKPSSSQQKQINFWISQVESRHLFCLFLLKGTRRELKCSSLTEKWCAAHFLSTSFCSCQTFITLHLHCWDVSLYLTEQRRLLLTVSPLLFFFTHPAESIKLFPFIWNTSSVWKHVQTDNSLKAKSFSVMQHRIQLCTTVSDRISPNHFFDEQHEQQHRLLYLILLCCDDALSNDFLSKLCQDSFLLLDPLVHQRLSEHGLIDLIMAVTSVAHLNVTKQ